jgi:hypothetical protein
MLQESHLTVNHAVEIIGKVQADLSVRVLTSTDFGENIGMDMNNRFCYSFRLTKYPYRLLTRRGSGRCNTPPQRDLLLKRVIPSKIDGDDHSPVRKDRRIMR